MFQMRARRRARRLRSNRESWPRAHPPIQRASRNGSGRSPLVVELSKAEEGDRSYLSTQSRFSAPTAKTVFPQVNFILVNIHPIFEPWFKSAMPFNWAEFVVRVTDRLGGVFSGPVLIKETGVPTGPAGLEYTEDKQRAFYRELEAQLKPSRSRAFAYFSAFDAPWLAGAPNPIPGPPSRRPIGAFLPTCEFRKPLSVNSGLFQTSPKIGLLTMTDLAKCRDSRGHDVCSPYSRSSCCLISPYPPNFSFRVSRRQNRSLNKSNVGELRLRGCRTRRAKLEVKSR